MQGSDSTPRAAGFTLVELILVMALLAIVTALAVPSLSRSLRQRYLDQEAARFLALTEYARSEAVSQGVPMTVWIESATRRFGVEPKEGFEGAEARNREFTLNPDVQFEITGGVVKRGVVEAVEFAPDGAPALSSLDSVRLVDRFDSALTVARTSDGWSYEIVKEAK
jgi:type IV fimbrial biogenesis protein FimT